MNMFVLLSIYRFILTLQYELCVLGEGHKIEIHTLQMKYMQNVTGVGCRNRMENAEIGDI